MNGLVAFSLNEGLEADEYRYDGADDRAHLHQIFEVGPRALAVFEVGAAVFMEGKMQTKGKMKDETRRAEPFMRAEFCGNTGLIRVSSQAMPAYEPLHWLPPVEDSLQLVSVPRVHSNHASKATAAVPSRVIKSWYSVPQAPLGDSIPKEVTSVVVVNRQSRREGKRVLEVSSDEDLTQAADPNVLEVSSDEDETQAADPNVLEVSSDEADAGTKANPIVVAPTPSPAKKTPKTPAWATRFSRVPFTRDASSIAVDLRMAHRKTRLQQKPELVLRILKANLRVDTNSACLSAMARSGLKAMMSNDIVLPNNHAPVPRPRPGQSSETVEHFTVGEEVQMREWEAYEILRSSFVAAALAVLQDQDPDAPYAVVRRKYTLYVDPFQSPPQLADVDPNHKCGLCGSLASHPVLLWCNHLFCFVCARVHLNKSWLCPDGTCGALQRRPPWRRLELENEISLVYTGFADFTQVHYGWGDVRFPGAGSSGLP
ncbi:hypothetical protein C8F01DRAFT_1085446 [Mycena amicta]|nr:hypothetical protein C8F01DRAFT_1085446 [Mycena amicta]